MYLAKFHGQREDERAGTIAAASVRFAVKPEGFFPNLRRPQAEKSVEEQIAQVKRDTLARGGKVE